MLHIENLVNRCYTIKIKRSRALNSKFKWLGWQNTEKKKKIYVHFILYNIIKWIQWGAALDFGIAKGKEFIWGHKVGYNMITGYGYNITFSYLYWQILI